MNAANTSFGPAALYGSRPQMHFSRAADQFSAIRGIRTQSRGNVSPTDFYGELE
jgi:hypothetical protein